MYVCIYRESQLTESSDSKLSGGHTAKRSERAMICHSPLFWQVQRVALIVAMPDLVREHKEPNVTCKNLERPLNVIWLLNEAD